MRRTVFKALVGSHNYNLNTKTSDKDYKVFVAPTFDDLYHNHQFSKSIIGYIDVEYHDIRKIPDLWRKSNINFVEVLFSNEFLINRRLKEDSISRISNIFEMKNQIAKMNLPYLYDACVGMHMSKKKQIDKGTKNTQDLVDKHGYDTKQAMHSIRVLDFLERFANNNFTDFQKAIWYDHPEKMLQIKNGYLSREDYLKIADDMLNKTESQLKEIYRSQKPDEKLNQFLIDEIKAIVKNEI